MTDSVVNLLALYAGLLLINTVVAVTMYWISRAELYRDLVLVWGSMLLAFMAQGATSAVAPHLQLAILAGFVGLWVPNMAFARLIQHIFDVTPPWRASAVFLAVALAVSVVLSYAGVGFTLMALPTALAVCFPMLVTTVRAITHRWGETTPAARALLLACLAIVAHTLDYPFLRMVDELTALGFTIAIMVVFALSIFAPAVVAEIMTARQARLSAELAVARRIQTKVLPSNPSIPGFEIACHMKTAEEVGGDYYDMYTFGNHSWILVGDVTGHGLSSGLVMLMAQSVLASILHTRQEISPADLAFLANRILYQNLQRLEELRSMTLVALCRLGDGSRFVYSGNHDHLYIYRGATGQVEVVDVSQVPHDIGFMDEFPRSAWSEASFEVCEGDLLLATTDGVTEAPHHGSYASGMFEQERLVTLVREIAERPLEEIKQRLLDELEQFTGGVYHDDVTFVLARPLSRPFPGPGPGTPATEASP